MSDSGTGTGQCELVECLMHFMCHRTSVGGNGIDESFAWADSRYVRSQNASQKLQPLAERCEFRDASFGGASNEKLSYRWDDFVMPTTGEFLSAYGDNLGKIAAQTLASGSGKRVFLENVGSLVHDSTNRLSRTCICICFSAPCIC